MGAEQGPKPRRQYVITKGKKIFFPDDYDGMVETVEVFFPDPISKRDAYRKLFRAFGQKFSVVMHEIVEPDKKVGDEGNDY